MSAGPQNGNNVDGSFMATARRLGRRIRNRLLWERLLYLGSNNRVTAEQLVSTEAIDLLEEMIAAESPTAPERVVWYAREALLPTGREEEAVDLLQQVKSRPEIEWDGLAWTKAMRLLAELAPKSFTD